MSKPKGIIVIELPEVPEDCYHCNQIDGTYGYCEHVGKFVDHFVKPGERHRLCPIREMPQPRTDCNWEEYEAGWDDCLLAFLGELPEAEEKPQGPSKPLSPMDKIWLDRLRENAEKTWNFFMDKCKQNLEEPKENGPRTRKAMVRIIGMEKDETLKGGTKHEN